MINTSGSLVNGKGCIDHNLRKFTQKHIDKNRTHLNKILINKKLDDAYKEIFSESIERYNQKQKRYDRKKSVESYLQEIENNKHKKGAEKPFYELIIQIGDKELFTKNAELRENASKALEEYFYNFLQRNKQLVVFNATLHLDEASPHLHIDYIPVATGYKQGLDKRNSLSKALTQQGLGKNISQYDNSSINWQNKEREFLKETALKYGFIIETQEVKREHLSVSEYKKLKEQTKKQINQEIISNKKNDAYNEIKMLNQAISKKEVRLKEMESSIKQELIKYEKFLDEKKEVIEKINKDFLVITNNKQKQNDELTNITNDLEKKKAKLDILITEISNNEKKLLNSKKELEEISKKIDIKKDELHEKNEYLNKLESEIITTNQELKKLCLITENKQEELNHQLNQAFYQGVEKGREVGRKETLLVHQIPMKYNYNKTSCVDEKTGITINKEDEYFKSCFAISDSKFEKVTEEINDAKKKSYKKHMVGAILSR